MSGAPAEPKPDPNCDHEWERHDDSFDHEFGVEVIRYMLCTKCGKQADRRDEQEAAEDLV